jgi:predicted MFS family arabinose efflux permease
MVGSANIYGASVGALAAVFLVRHIRWKPALFGLLSLLLLIDLASTLVRDPMMLMVARAVHGVVGGLSVGIAYSVMARTRSPDRAFGMLLLVQFGLGGLGVMFLPTLVPIYGAQVLFLALAGLTGLALLSMTLIPKDLARGDSRRVATGAAAGYSRFTAVATLLALFLFQGGNMALAAFIIGLGEHASLARDFIGQALGWATWIGAAGAGLVIVMGTRLGRFRPLLAALLLTLAGTFAFLWSQVPLVYFVANVGTAITWSFVVPYLFGMVSRLDESGRLAVLGGFVSKAGLASGPLLAGLLLGEDAYGRLIIAAAGLLALSGVFALVAARRVDRLAQALA